MATQRESNVFGIQVAELTWEAIPDQVLRVGEAFLLDLNDYLPTGIHAAVTRKAGSGTLPEGLTLVNGVLSGVPTTVLDTIWTRPVFLATAGTISVESDEVNMATLAQGDWTPTVTGLEAEETVTWQAGKYWQIGSSVQFQGKFAASHSGLWTTMAPKLSLPVASTAPSDVLGAAAGYGGSQQKFVGARVSDLSGDLWQFSSSLYYFSGAAVVDGVIYLCRDKWTSLGGNPNPNMYTLTPNDLGQLDADTTPAAYDGFTGHRFSCMAYHDDNLYAVGVNATHTQGALFRLTLSDTQSSRVTAVVSSTNYYISTHIGMESFEDKLYILVDNSFSSRLFLYEVDTSTGTLTNRGRVGQANRYNFYSFAETLFAYNGKLHFISRGILYEINITSGSSLNSVSEVASLDTGRLRAAAAWHLEESLGDRVYFIRGEFETAQYLRYFHEEVIYEELSIDFHGTEYTTSVGQCVLSDDNLIQVEFEKLQQGDGDALIQVTGSYEV